MAGSDRVAGIHSEIKYKFDAKSITNLRKFKRDLMELKTNMAAIQKMAKRGVTMKVDMKNTKIADKAAKDTKKVSDKSTSDEVKRSAQVWKMREKILRNQINEARIKDQASQKEITRAAKAASDAQKASQKEITRVGKVHKQRIRITEESRKASQSEVKRSADVWKMREKILKARIAEARQATQASSKEVTRAGDVWKMREKILKARIAEAKQAARDSSKEVSRAAKIWAQRVKITEEVAKAARLAAKSQKDAMAMEAKIASQRAKLRRMSGRAAEGGTATPSSINRITRAQEALNRAYREGSITSGHFSTQSSRLTAILQRQSTAAQGGTRSFNQLRTSLMAATGAYSAFAGLGTVKNIGGGFEDAKVMLETAFGGTEEATNMMDFLITQSKRLGIEAAATAKGFARYSIAGKEMGFTNAQLQEQFLGLAEGASVFGLRQDEFTGVLRSFEQMASKGTVMAKTELIGHVKLL